MTRMNFSRYDWNENNRCELLEFLKTSTNCKNNEYCNETQYNKLNQLFPLENEIKKDLLVYLEKENICIDITQSDDEEIVNIKSHNIDFRNKQENNTVLPGDVDNIQSISIYDNNKQFIDLVESIKDSLRIEKTLSKTLLNDLLHLDSIHLENSFCYFAKEFNLDDLKNLWNSFKECTNINSSVIKCFVHLLLSKAKREFINEIHEIFLNLCQKHDIILKCEIVETFLQKSQKEDEPPNILIQYVTSFSNNYKSQILRDFISTAKELHSNYIPIIEALLNPTVDTDVLGKVIQIMATAVTDFSTDNAYGKLLFKVVHSFDKNLEGSEQPLKRILGTHRSIWRIKVEKVVGSWFNDSLTQSFI